MSPAPPGCRAVLLDIEGTTTPLSFVHQVLFPYAARHCEDFLDGRSAEPEVAAALRQLADEHRQESAQRPAVPPFGGGAPFVRYLMASDRKSPGLKLLQGLVWKEGYESGRLRGEVFADVPPAFAAWRRDGVGLRIFSSGSVLAQRLLFSTTPHGDLTVYLDGFHDLATGPKHEPGSYRTIAAAFGVATEEILFVSDAPAELDAASAAGLQTRLAERAGNAAVPASGHPRIRSFAEISAQSSRRN